MKTTDVLTQLCNTSVDDAPLREALAKLVATHEQLRMVAQTLQLQIIEEPNPQVDAYLQSLLSIIRASSEFCEQGVTATMGALSNIKRMPSDLQGVLDKVTILEAV